MGTDEIRATGEYLDLIVGGGASSIIAALYLFYTIVFKPKIEDINKRLADDSQAFIEANEMFIRFKAHTEEAINRLDSAESRIEDFILEARTEIGSNKDRMSDFRSQFESTTQRVNDIESRERGHYEELKKMSGNAQLLEQRLEFIEKGVLDMKEEIRTMSRSFSEFKDLAIELRTLFKGGKIG